MRKKVIAVLLSVSLCLLISTAAFAADNAADTGDPVEEAAPEEEGTDEPEPAEEPLQGLHKEDDVWGYYVDGEVDTSYTGFASNESGDWYVDHGYVTFSDAYSSVYKDTTGAIGEKGAWYYVIRSKVQRNFTGLANYKNENGWWYISGGKVNFKANTVAKNKNGWWYVTGGKV